MIIWIFFFKGKLAHTPVIKTCIIMYVQFHWSCTNPHNVNLQILGFATLIFVLQCFSNQQTNPCPLVSQQLSHYIVPHIRTFYATIRDFFPFGSRYTKIVMIMPVAKDVMKQFLWHCTVTTHTLKARSWSRIFS